ncbi:hypothetical protein DMN91_005541 [Ooceraea biroi]|uniref:Uncharacterized protein n=1 Tax=Ooceraea biroi TaxID=2015173 RepID=A0A3L8DMW6_OOCBI|nr:hypothetical protein DMN91_005541 [Ooceraea biroi]
MDEFNRNFGKFVDRCVEASSKISARADVESTDFSGKPQQRQINYYRSRPQSCREKYESGEAEVCGVKEKLQWRGLFVLDNAREDDDEINLRERLRDIHLSDDACTKEPDSQNLSETIRANMNELTSQRNSLMEELVQLRRHADDNGRKLAHVNAVITEQEEKNVTLL